MRPRGFTLLEVLVALSVFAISAVVLGSAYVNVLNAYDLAKRGAPRNEEVRFARAQLLVEPDLKKAEEGGDFDLPGGRHLRWRATIEPTGAADLFQVTFICELTESGTAAPQTVTETFMLLRPTWADPVENTKLRQKTLERIAEIKARKK